MSRVHVALNTNRFEESVAFYSKLFGSDPAKLWQDWAKFDLQDPALNLTLNRSDKTVHHGDINHLGFGRAAAEGDGSHGYTRDRKATVCAPLRGLPW